jgi:hypothetical protein
MVLVLIVQQTERLVVVVVGGVRYKTLLSKYYFSTGGLQDSFLKALSPI